MSTNIVNLLIFVEKKSVACVIPKKKSSSLQELPNSCLLISYDFKMSRTLSSKYTYTKKQTQKCHSLNVKMPKKSFVFFHLYILVVHTFFAIFQVMDIRHSHSQFVCCLAQFQSHHSEEVIVNDENFAAAEKVVKEFLAARIVYRRFDKPIGSVRLDDDKQQYSIRGYFIPAQHTGYQFITYNPIKQFYEISTVSTLNLIFFNFRTRVNLRQF